MLNIYHQIIAKRGLELLYIIIIMMCFTNISSAQQADTILNTPVINAKTVIATHRITLEPGFSANGAYGVFHASIVTFPIPNCVALSSSPSQDQNYITTFIPRAPFTDAASLASKNTCEVMQMIQYIDGMGRSLQSVQVKGNQNATRDVIMPVAYDQFGREATKYLPYTTSAGNPGTYRADALQTGTGQSVFYTSPPSGVTQNPSPFSVTGFEPSPLNRVVEQGAPGTDWQLGAHTVKTIYATNNAADVSGRWARLYTVDIDASGNRTLNDHATGYGVNQLSVTITQDENWISANGRSGTIEEYKDKGGNIVLKRTFNGTEILSTYYIYDDLGNLCYVLPPQSLPDNGGISQATLDNLCYQYQYDKLNRRTQKKLPGKGAEEMVYNLLDQVIFSRDANQQNRVEWNFMKYDALGRLIMLGVHIQNTNTRQALQDYVTTQLSQGSYQQWETPNATGLQGYTSNAFPVGENVVPLVVNYYDDYSFPGKPYNSSVSGTLTNPKNLVTGTKVVLLKPDGTYGDMLWTVNFYDDKGRIVQKDKQHYLNGTVSTGNYDEIVNTYNFNDQLTSSNRRHYTTASSLPAVLVGTSYTYDHVGRKVQTWESISNGNDQPSAPILLSQIDYNEVGKVLAKHLHSTNNGSSFLQDITYGYNERGWPENSSSSLFAVQLDYNNNVPSGGQAQWNGNISGQDWGVPGNLSKRYTYIYDPVNRLTAGNSTTGYNENGIDYDKQGNIQHLSRNHPLTGNVNYTYHYSGNQLASVDNLTVNSYTYDSNGNMNHDGRNNTDVNYNMLNLPRSLPGKTLTYTYGANGEKKNKSNGSISTDYINGIQYENGQLQFIQTEEGRALKSGNDWNYEYTLADHLGNSRVNFMTISGTADVKQTDDYYPFGMEILTSTYPSQKNQYLYNGKELQAGTGNYDYDFRHYDPLIGRFNTADPLAEANRRFSPYVYGNNNPLRFIDPDGMDSEDVMAPFTDYVNELGGLITHTDDGLDRKVTVHDNQMASFNQAMVQASVNGTTNDAGTNTQLSNIIDSENNAARGRFSGGSTSNQGVMNSDQALFNFGITASSVENLSGISRLGSNLRVYSATQSGGVFMGNQFIRTFSISKLGKGAGYIGAILGTGIDIYGVSQGTVTPGQAMENGAFTTIGLKGGWPGAIVSSMYFGLNAYYPGGANGYTGDLGQAIKDMQQQNPAYRSQQMVP